MSETPSKTPKEANLKPPWKKGESGNKNGRPKGQRNYETLYREALIQIGKSQDKTPEEIEELMHKSGLTKAIKGDYAFYRDVLDRLYGKPKQSVGLEGTGEGGALEIVIKKL